MATNAAILWLNHGRQRLGLLPALGGGVAAWRLHHGDRWVDLWRPWDGSSEDRYTFANFPLLPWTNRISGGGFDADGRFHPVAPNRPGEPYPIHGDGWLQPWDAERVAADTMRLHLVSDRFGGNPHHYRATQTFRLLDDGLDQTLAVTHLGDTPLPYGLGLHPYFPRSTGTRITAAVDGVWLGGDDPLPTGHTDRLPDGWDLPHGAPAHGSFIDNCFTGWSGEATVDWPDTGLRVRMRDLGVTERRRRDGFCLVYRPPVGGAFCLEPVSHPIDAFHVDGRPGLRVLQPGETMQLAVQWRVERPLD